ncbi:MAG: transcriptional regulator, partial [Spirochaetes bacterium RIFOXYC1_FULL_54_7]
DKELHDLIATGEGYHLELKETVDKSFLEEVCAFANSSGGRIIVGITDDGTIKGCPTDNRSRSLIQDTLRSLQPNLDIPVEVVGSLFVVTVPEGNDKPYACPKGFYLRNGANSQKLSRNEIVEFFQKEGRIRFDELCNRKAVFDTDFDDRAFNDFMNLAGISKSLDKQEILRNLNCLTEDSRLTNAGVLFFAKDIDFILENAIVVCVLFKGIEKVHILDKKDFKGNILENINNAVAFVQRHTNLEYVIKTLRRENVPEIPEVALRETIINAVCHRDYFNKTANVMIEVFDDRVIISNPGGLPGGLRPQDFGKKSVARNQTIAALLHRVHFIEKVGTGINRIKQAVEGNARTSVDFSFDDAFFTVTFTRMQAVPEETTQRSGLPEKASEKTGGFSKSSQETTQETTQRTTQKTTQTLSGKQTELLNYLKLNPEASRQEMAQHIADITADGIKYNLKRLQDIGLLKRVGPDKGGHWEVFPQDDENRG